MKKKKAICLFKYEHWLETGEKILVEVIDTKDPKYLEGIMYTFRCISTEGKTLFAVENSHGKPHIHLNEKKIEVEYDWKQALSKFEEMKAEYGRKTKFEHGNGA